MKRKWWQGRSADIEVRAEDVGIPAPDESVPDARATDTGSADARDGAVAVSGIRGPGPAGQTRASGTGDAIAVAGVAVSGVVGSIGDIDQSVRTYAAPRAPAAWPHQVGVIPRRAEAFVRRAEMAEIRDVGLPASCRILTGTGGVGKTQLAADFARRAWDAGEVDVLVWITATTRSAIVTGYARAAVEILGMDGDDPDEAAKSFLAWLEPKPNQRPCRRLIVLDDVADPTDLRGLWPPPGPHGCCVLTTRRRDAALGPERRLTHVGLFTADQAAAYLTTALAAHGRAEPADQLASLAADLGRLPLALSQAVAYLVDAGVDCATYRRLLAERLPEPDTLPDDQTLAVSALWSLSIDRANRLTPVGLALPMLRLAAMLDPNGIPGTVLTGASARDHLAQDRDRPDSFTEERAVAREESAVSVDDAIGALRALHRLNLIDHITHGPLPTVRVHQLVQRTARAPLASVERDRLARIAADSLVDVWPEGERDAELVEALRANTDVLCGHAGAALWDREAHVAMYHAGKSLGTTGRVGAAAEHFRQMLTTAHRHLGADHPDTLMIRSNLAGWRAEAGDAAGAARAFEELLADELRILGPDHPQTLGTRCNLAYWRGEAGDAAGAVRAFEELLADELRILGPDHSNTLTTRNNLAYWRGGAGDTAGAARAFRELLADQLRILGPDHPQTLGTRNNLASKLGEAGDISGAVTTFEQLLADQLRVLGPDHPDTLISRSNLAGWRAESGDVAGAVRALEELLADQLRILGPEHPNTLTTRSNLAGRRGDAGDVAGAMAACEELLAVVVRTLGAGSPATLAIRGNLAYWQAAAGDVTGAAAACEQLLTDQLRILGSDHPNTLTTRRNLAGWRGATGDAAGAAAAFEELLTDQLRVLGPDHPDTLSTRGHLAGRRGKAGDAEGAAAAFAELLTDQLRILGPDHPKVLITRRNLAGSLWQAGDAAGAAAALRGLRTVMVTEAAVEPGSASHSEERPR